MKLSMLGAPGAGKGTQAHFISEHYDIAHISTGDLLRDEMKRKTQIGEEINELMNKGQLVADETVISVLKERLTKDDCKNGFLLDGFPRTLAQAELAEKIVGKLDKVVSIHVDDDVIIERMGGRRICKDCGATYHMVYKKPKKDGVCDLCGGELVQRDDDKAKTVSKRLSIYHEQAEPIKAFFKSKGILFVVNGTDDIEVITENIIKALDK